MARRGFADYRRRRRPRFKRGPLRRTGLRGLPFYKQLAATFGEAEGYVFSTESESVEGVCGRRDAEAMTWRTAEDAFIEVLEGDQVVDGVRELWFSRNVTNETELHGTARFKRRALTHGCNPEYGHADAKLCARAEEIVARADVDGPARRRRSTRRSPEARRPRLRRRVVEKGGLRRLGAGSY